VANIGLLLVEAVVLLATLQVMQDPVVLIMDLQEYLVDHGLVQVVEHLEIIQEDLL
tara:strand:- start:140 stop:307 length:168 start_codon:yes stop_codon:yes gene_type:complete